MLDIGIQELLVIMVLALLIFGPDKLPDLGRRLGRAMREFRRASDEFRSTVEQNLQLNADLDISSPSTSSVEPQAASAPVDASAVSAVAGTGSTAGDISADILASSNGASDGLAGADLLEPYWTSRGGRLLHRRECAWRARVPASECLPVKTALDGWEQGLQPCPVCDPKEAAVAS
jgi:TatA/E family protein of Tat protein translocase